MEVHQFLVDKLPRLVTQIYSKFNCIAFNSVKYLPFADHKLEDNMQLPNTSKPPSQEQIRREDDGASDDETDLVSKT